MAQRTRSLTAKTTRMGKCKQTLKASGEGTMASSVYLAGVPGPVTCNKSGKELKGESEAACVKNGLWPQTTSV